MAEIEFDYYHGDEYEIKNPDKIIVGNIYDKPGNTVGEKNNEFIVGKKTDEGLNIRFVDRSEAEDLQKGAK